MTAAGNKSVVAVAGATGFVGRAVCSALVAAGHPVRALVRDAEKARRVLPEGIETVQAERIGPDACRELAQGADAGVYAVGILRETGPGQRFKLLHVEGVRWFCEALRAAGATRVAHVSALGADPEGRAEYQRSKHRGEAIVRSSRLGWTIFRPSLVHGASGEFTRMAAEWARGKRPPFFVMPYFTRRADDRWSLEPGALKDPVVAPIHVDDLASAIVRSLSDEQTVGEVINAVGPQTLAWPDLLTMVRDRVKHASKGIQPGGVPAPPAHALATALQFVGLGQFLPFDAGMASMASEDSVASLAKWRSLYDGEPRAFEASFAEYAGVL
ncbi:MAG: NAD(P)H-binding protein [Planctomycetota bacterium]